jgi:hypothetical protein
MVRTARDLVVTVALAALLAGRGLAQAPPPSPLSGVPETFNAPLPPLILPPLTPATYHCSVCLFPDSRILPPAPPACAPFEDRNGPLLCGDPLLDGYVYGPPGLIADLELPIVVPHLRNQLVAPVTVGPMTTSVHAPPAPLAWTVAPRFELGYRMPQGAGELLVSYRFLTTSGSDTQPTFDAAGNAALLRSRLDFNVVDLDYANHESSLIPDWDMKWWTGVRFANVFFDATAASPLLFERTSDNTFGVGPHGGLELQRCLGESGFSFFSRLDTAILFTQTRQHFGETLFGEATGETRLSHTWVVPYLAVQLGAVWRPPQNERVSVALGYTFERWWEVGELLSAFPVGSKGELTVQGVYLRFAWSY